MMIFFVCVIFAVWVVLSICRSTMRKSSKNGDVYIKEKKGRKRWRMRVSTLNAIDQHPNTQQQEKFIFQLYPTASTLYTKCTWIISNEKFTLSKCMDWDKFLWGKKNSRRLQMYAYIHISIRYVA